MNGTNGTYTDFTRVDLQFSASVRMFLQFVLQTKFEKMLINKGFSGAAGKD